MRQIRQPVSFTLSYARLRRDFRKTAGALVKLKNIFSPNVEIFRRLQLVMMFTLVFAALHVASHDPSDDAGHPGLIDTCQTCRLSQLSVDLPPAPILVVAFQKIAFDAPLQGAEPHRQFPRSAWYARAPPPALIDLNPIC